MTHLKNALGWLCLALVMGLGITMLAYPAAITQLAGLAVAQSLTQWNQLKDMAIGDAQSNGSALVTPCLWNGTTCDRQRGTIAGGALVTQAQSGNAVFSVKRDNIAAASVNLAFGFTSKKIAVRADPTNTDEICIDWLGTTAVCPAANTSGDGRLKPGTTFVLDDYAQTSLSVIAASGTQIIYIDAWN
jgi:hypothetical protein